MNLKMKDFKTRNTPFVLGFKLEEVKPSPLENNIVYRKLVGCIIYLNHIRPNIYYAVTVDFRHIYQPHDIHCREAKRILNFVQ